MVISKQSILVWTILYSLLYYLLMITYTCVTKSTTSFWRYCWGLFVLLISISNSSNFNLNIFLFSFSFFFFVCFYLVWCTSRCFIDESSGISSTWFGDSAWWRYKDLLIRFPYHGFSKEFYIQLFLRGLHATTRNWVERGNFTTSFYQQSIWWSLLYGGRHGQVRLLEFNECQIFSN